MLAITVTSISVIVLKIQMKSGQLLFITDFKKGLLECFNEINVFAFYV